MHFDVEKVRKAVRASLKRATTEDTVEDYLVKKVQDNGGVAPKLLFLTGWPDRLVLLPGGVAVFVELKRPTGGKDEPLQPRVQRMLRKLGFRVEKLHTKQQIDELLIGVIRTC